MRVCNAGIVADPEHEARRREQRPRSYASAAVTFAWSGGWTGGNLAQLQKVEVRENARSVGIQNGARWFANHDPHPTWTLAEVGETMKLSGMAVLLVSTPTQIADELERWGEESGVDGFNLVPLRSHSPLVPMRQYCPRSPPSGRGSLKCLAPHADWLQSGPLNSRRSRARAAQSYRAASLSATALAYESVK